MSSPLLLADREDTPYIHPRRLRARDRLAARLTSPTLDRALARGASPDSSARLSLRAHTLIGIRARTQLARSLRGTVEVARLPCLPLTSAVPVCRRAVLGCAQAFEDLAARLEAPAPVQAQGVAQAWLLVGDGTSPIYYGGRQRDLERALRRALAALDPVQ